MSTNTAVKHMATVTSGPSAVDIANSFLYAYSAHKIPVTFTVDIVVDGVMYRGVQFEASIMSVSYESGAPGMFIITFFVTKGYAGRGTRCSGFYNANRRTGTLSIELL